MAAPSEGQCEFDVLVIVDWSANATPKRGADSIWSYELDLQDDSQHEPVNHRTRADARAHLVDLLVRHEHRSVLLGVDFPFGYPAGFARAAGLVRPGTAPWAVTWAHLADRLTDDTRNRNNRWEVAAELNERMGHHRFWGSPPSRAGAHLPTHRPIPPATDRAAEARFRSRGLRPFSPWQLLGAGSVGSQSLTGIPMLQHLRQHEAFAHRTRVWPFETGLAAPDTTGGNVIVMAEVWPSSVDFSNDLHAVKDARQVRALAESLAADQRAGRLRAAFQPSLADDVAAAVVAEEGWVLGLA